MNDPVSKFILEAAIEDRLIILRTFSTASRCPACNTGPVDTTDATKLITFGKVWDLFKLDDLVDLSSEDLLKRIKSSNENLSVEFNANTLRFTIETILARSYMLTGFTFIVDLTERLLKIADATNTKLPGRSTDTVASKNVKVSFQDLIGITNSLLTFKPCENKFQTNNGVANHNVAVDFPKNIKEFDTYHRLVSQLSVLPLLLGKDSIARFDGEKEYTLDEETVNYLKTLIVGRSTNINFPANKLAGIIEKLG